MGNTKEALATEHTLQGDEIVCGLTIYASEWWEFI